MTISASANASVWNGTTYVRGEPKSPDPYALAWWSVLNTIADLLEAQDTPVGFQQIAYLRRTIFGGMGSFSDISFPQAPSIDARLAEKRRNMFSAFNE